MRYQVKTFTKEQEKQLQKYCAKKSILLGIDRCKAYRLLPKENEGFTEFYIYNFDSAAAIIKEELLDGLDTLTSVSLVDSYSSPKQIIEQIEQEIESMRT
jgi:hypothetical protein